MTDHKPPHELQRSDAAFDAPARYDDEISLYDLWDVLERRWYVILGVLVLTILLGLAYALNQEPSYQYRSGLEIGSVDTENGLIESPSEVRNRLREGIIPSVRVELSGEMESVPRVSLGGGEESALIVLSTDGVVDREDDIHELHSRIANQLEEAHLDVVDSRRGNLERRLESLEDELEYITDDRVLAARRESHEQAIESAEQEIDSLRIEQEERQTSLNARIRDLERRQAAIARERATAEAELERIDDRVDLIEGRIGIAEGHLNDLRDARMQLTNASGDDSNLAFFLSTTEASQIQRRLDNLQDELNFELAGQRDSLRSTIAEKTEERDRVEDELESLQLELDNLDARYERRIDAQQRTVRSEQTELARMEADLQQDRRDTERRIRGIEADIDDLAPTRANFVSVRSIDQTGIGGSLILALSAVLGGMLGLFAAFFWEFVSNARARRA